MMKVNDELFGMPAQDIFCFCDINDPKSAEMLKQTTAETFNDPSQRKKISGSIYRKEGDKLITVFNG